VKQWFPKGQMKQGFDEEEMQSERASESYSVGMTEYAHIA
jgi:hypothetical protein